ncbi:MAG: glycosyltransferase family 2 protein [Alphaproteobacteria bacterium]|nr:glycosyltransferase family 2 protein [Alphaproteobacteria bacterium]
MNNIPDISFVVPMYNEEDVIATFFSTMDKTLKKIPQYTYEFICVNDGSKDKTLPILKEYATKDRRIKIISFSRNFYKEQALFAGLEASSGRCVIPMDADLQDPPALILKFIKKWQEGYEVVYGVRTERTKDTLIKRITANLFYKIFNFIADRPIPANTGDYRLMDRKVVDAILQIKENKLFMKGIFSWVGFKSCGVEYQRPKRAAGKTKFNYWKLWNFALDGITASTTLPLRIWTYIGSFIAAISGLYALYIIGRTLFMGVSVPGYASLLVCILFFGSVQLIVLGIFGEYIGRIFMEVKRRPRYIIDEKINLIEHDKI